MKNNIKKGYTFNDLLLIPNQSDVLPASVNLKTQLTPKLTLNIPLIGAGMDTVTESEMAQQLALYGGLGIIHKNLSIKQQVSEIEKVKAHK